jgi:Tfp pilus assembly protein PilV
MMNRRGAFSLTEVLVATFVLALGLMALLTLFPLGALTMGQAIQDDRAALTAANGMAALQVWDAHLDPGVAAATTQDLPPNWPADAPGWAVYVDPVGARSFAAPGHLGGTPATRIKRVSVQKLTNLPAALQNQATYGWCVLLDDLSFTDQGTPALGDDPANPRIAWEGRYSWAALLRRPAHSSAVTEVSVVVYRGRAISLNASLTPAGEDVFAVSPAAVVGSTTLTLRFNGTPPGIRAGGWILDATPEPGHGLFYRVGSVDVAADRMEVELQTPVRGPARGTAAPQPPYTITQVMVLANVAEVFDKGTIGP